MTESLRTDRRDGVLIVTLDQPGDTINKVDRALGEELERLLGDVERDSTVDAMVFTSGKKDIFIAGADIQQFLEFREEADAENAARYGQRLLGLIEKVRVPVVAAIHGACLGGGLELALACKYRVCSDHAKTVLALPEVQLGLIPGMGGTQRLPRLIRLPAALDMILTGRNVRAKKALEMGLVDEMMHPDILLDVAVRRAAELAGGTLRPRRRGRRGIASLMLDRNPLGRSVVFNQANKGVVKKTHGNYPAPLAAIEVIRFGLANGMTEGLAEEARVFGQMAMTPESRQLVGIFFATNALKKDFGVAESAPGGLARPVEKIAVLGAGFMGAGIASVAAQHGTIVRMKDTELSRVGKGLAAVRDILKERLDRRQITKQQFADMLTLVGGTTDYSGFGNVDLAIEAVFEDLALKHNVLQVVEQVLPPRAVIASNTSTIPIREIASALKRRDRVLGMHFFSPVHKMPLVEVITTKETAPDATVTAVSYARALGKTVIVVNDGPGFYTTRILSAYLNEAGWLLEQGEAIEVVDRALVQFGFPVGPITLMDEVGLDVGGKVGKVMAEAFGERAKPSGGMKRVVESGRTGRKGKSGFYMYDARGRKKGPDISVYSLIHGDRPRDGLPPESLSDGEIVDRCVMAMVNEAVRCLEEGILRSPRDGDIGAVFGLGFPPFRGGPFRYIDTLGVDEVLSRLDTFDGRYPTRYRPAQMLVEMSRARKRFHPADGRSG